MFLSGLMDSHHINGTFDFEMKIAYVNNKLIFIVVLTNINWEKQMQLENAVNLDLTNGGPVIVITYAPFWVSLLLA